MTTVQTTSAAGPRPGRPGSSGSPGSRKRERRNPVVRWFGETGWRHLVGLAVLVFALFPIVFVISASLNPVGTLTGSNDLFGAVSLDNYRALFDTPLYPYPRWFLNTMFVAFTTAVLQVFVAACAAYAFSRFRFAGRRIGLLGLLLAQMFPQLLAAVAIFLLMFEIGALFPGLGIGTTIGLVLVYMGGALGVSTFLIKGFFDTIPKELDEAMKVDGASHVRVYFGMVLPLAVPVLAVVSLLSFITTINEYIIASIILTQVETQTLAVGLYQLVSQQLSANWGFFAAGALLGAIPSILLFQYLQRYIVSGLTSGSLK